MASPPTTDTNPLRLQILRRAQEEFFAHGFSKVTTDDLAAMLGISKKTLYQHFDSKEQILRESLYLMRDEIVAAIDGFVSDPGLGFMEKFRGILGAVGMRMARVRRPYFDDIRKKAPELWAEIEAFRRERILLMMTRLIREGSERGELRKDVEPEIFMMMFFAIVQNVITPEVLAEVPFSASAVFESFITVMLTGILTDEARAAHTIAPAPADAGGSR